MLTTISCHVLFYHLLENIVIQNISFVKYYQIILIDISVISKTYVYNRNISKIRI
uniref:Uncharacterized protein n=1 Tax=Siphoviridae sp. ctRcp9 TaxID=2825504 RepID=A0A8S5PK39_9CAUD|nr:MAG TPA: hypothetical protein [Siphoviridae sp. ctRcp9]